MRVGLVGRIVSLELVVAGALSTNLIDNQLAGEEACAPSTAALLAKAARTSQTVQVSGAVGLHSMLTSRLPSTTLPISNELSPIDSK